MKPILEPLRQMTLVGYDSKSSTVNMYDHKSIVIPHDHADIINGFALRLSGDKDNGTYVEIGSSHWLEGNHTYMLEKEFGWRGVGIEIESHYVYKYNENRSNPCIQADAKTFNWDKYFEENNFPNQIDHLSIDIDNGNFLSLINMPLSRYRFSTIVIENLDHFDTSSRIKINDEIKSVLLRYNYTLIGSGFTDDFWIDNTYLNLMGNQYDQLSYAFWHGDIRS
jgi:hypothetical protein